MGTPASTITQHKTYYYQSDRLCSHWFEKDGRIHGEYKRYYLNGILKYSFHYEGDKFHGEHKEYYENTVLKRHCHYENNRLIGRLIEYYSDSKIHRDEQYEHGHINGYSKEYDKNGKIVKYAIHRHNQSNSDSLILTALYENDVLQMYEVFNFNKQYWFEDSICVYDISNNIINSKIIDPIQLLQKQFRNKLYHRRFVILNQFITVKALVSVTLSYL
jgi:hypothetical protein